MMKREVVLILTCLALCSAIAEEAPKSNTGASQVKGKSYVSTVPTNVTCSVLQGRDDFAFQWKSAGKLHKMRVGALSVGSTTNDAIKYTKDMTQYPGVGFVGPPFPKVPITDDDIDVGIFKGTVSHFVAGKEKMRCFLFALFDGQRAWTGAYGAVTPDTNTVHLILGSMERIR